MQPINNTLVQTGVVHRFSAGFVDLMLAWPKTVLALFLVITAALGSQAPNFEINASPDTLLTRDNQLYTQTQLVNQRFSPQEFLLVTYEPQTHAVLSEQTFAALRGLSAELLALDRVQSVRSILNVPVFSQGPSLPTANLDLSALTIESGNYNTAALTEEFTDHPIYEDLLVNQDLSATALQVLFRNNETLQDLQGQITALNQRYQSGNFTEQDELELERLQALAEPLERELDRVRVTEIESIRAIIDNYDNDAVIHMGGVHVLGYQLIQIIANDLVVFGAAIGIGICLLLLILFQALRWVMIPVLCCLSSMVSTMGLFAILDIKATVISSNFIALQLIMTLAIVIHLIVQYRESAQESAGETGSEIDVKTHRELIRTTLIRKIGPCFFAGITTAVGFGSLVFSGIQPVIAFGWMMIIAMGFSICVSLVLFPVLLELLPPKAQRGRARIARRLTSVLSNMAIKRQGLILMFTLVFATVSISGLFLLTVENSFINYFRTSTQVHQELAYIDQEFGGSTPLDLVYTATLPNNPDLVMTANTVQMLQLIQHTLGEYEATGRILSAVNVTDLARELNDNRPLTEYELTAAYWLMDENFREDLLGAFYNPETGEARVNIWIKDLTPGLNRAQLLEDIRADMERIGVPESSYTLSNMFVLYQDILQRLFSSQILTLGLVYAVLTLTFVVLFRSFTIAIAAIIPNILSTLAVLGVMGWLGIPLDLMTITIAAIAMGIAVDDTIHYVHRYREEREHFDHEEAVKRTHASVGIAILYTSLLIVCGFSMLAFSDFIPSVLFGLLTALSMIIALLGVVCLLPILLRALVRKSKTAEPDPEKTVPAHTG
ncbi:MAG: efflux RND transporter permease subunit [Gammaproteobacteria bacterium]|nr:efflux RND transporter permease subunit [Gammaproteobacteria bacterium]